jgi:hypothetical protein
MIVVLGMDCSLSHIPTQRKGDKGGPNQAIFPIPTPWADESGKQLLGMLLIVSSDCKKRFGFCSKRE